MEERPVTVVVAISDRERQVLDFIGAHIAERGYPPTIREIGNQIGATSPSTPHHYLDRLERKGLIRREPRSPRALRLIQGGKK